MIMVAAIQAAAGVDGARAKQALAGGSAASRVLEVMGSGASSACGSVSRSGAPVTGSSHSGAKFRRKPLLAG